MDQLMYSPRVARESWGLRSSHCKAEETSPRLLHWQKDSLPLSYQGSPIQQAGREPSREDAGWGMPGKCSGPRPGSPVPSTPERREGLRACYWEGLEVFYGLGQETLGSLGLCR